MDLNLTPSKAAMVLMLLEIRLSQQIMRNEPLGELLLDEDYKVVTQAHAYLYHKLGQPD